MIQQNPNIAVWKTGDDYAASALVLEEANKIQPALVLAALAIEMYLKAFLSERKAPWVASTKRGHSHLDLYSKIDAKDKKDLERELKKVNIEWDMLTMLSETNNLFTEYRYFYELTSPVGPRLNIIRFANDIGKAVLQVAKLRGA